MRFKVNEIDNERYYSIPKALFTYKLYQGLSVQAKVIYAVLRDRMELSRKNNWVDANGDIYLKFKHQELADLLGISRVTVTREMKNLATYGLLETVSTGLGRTSKIYLHHITVPEKPEDVMPKEGNLGKGALAEEALDEQERIATLATQQELMNTVCSSMNTGVFTSEHGVYKSDTRSCSPADTRVNLTMSDTDLVNLKGMSSNEEEERAREHHSVLNTEKDSATASVLQSYRENFYPQGNIPLGPIEKETLKEWCRQYTPEWVKSAIHDAVMQGRKTLAYLDGILKGWQERGFRVRPLRVVQGKKQNSKQKKSQPEKTLRQEYTETLAYVSAMNATMGRAVL